MAYDNLKRIRTATDGLEYPGMTLIVLKYPRTASEASEVKSQVSSVSNIAEHQQKRLRLGLGR